MSSLYKKHPNGVIEILRSGTYQVSTTASLPSLRRTVVEAQTLQQMKSRFEGMNKFQLMEEVLEFQKRKAAEAKDNPKLCQEGLLLFTALENAGIESRELQILVKSYLKYLKDLVETYSR